ncbi:MAG: GspE/PulE family protein, partial [Saprospiraceae bacterium]
SDIHMEIYENRCRVRFRLDGALMERFELKETDYPVWVNRIKIKSNLDIAEKRLPQDGRILHKFQGRETDIRVSVLPTLYGEKVVLRLLNNDATSIELSQLGLSNDELENYLEGVKKPQGMVLISGPTGSGKTTTLYATLKRLNKNDTNILTIEDPIEYTLEGINQVQLKESIGLDFPSAMRTFLRQDPDVIMVGEIRDKATAEMAIRASLTGHLVLSTIHTNSAWGIVARLVDMGVPSYLLAGTLNTAVAQRLVRKNCSHCKKEELLSIESFPKGFKLPSVINHHFKGEGCAKCHFTGYKGRIAIYEVLTIDKDLSYAIKEDTFDIETILSEKGILSLSDNAFRLLKEGTTSLEEVYPILMG